MSNWIMRGMISRQCLLIICGWLWFFAALIPATDAGWPLLWQLVLYPTAIAITYGWVVLSVRFSSVFRSLRVIPWLSVPAAWLLIILLSVTNYGLTLRVWLCADELRTFAESSRADQQNVSAMSPGRTVGLFHVHSSDSTGSEVILITSRGAFNSYGIAYWPDQIPIGSGDEYQHLYGPWYRYRMDW